MDHIDIVILGNLDNFINLEVGLDWCVLTALTDGVGLIGLFRGVSSTRSDLRMGEGYFGDACSICLHDCESLLAGFTMLIRQAPTCRQRL
jgi:hypothetical protein